MSDGVWTEDGRLSVQRIDPREALLAPIIERHFLCEVRHRGVHDAIDWEAYWGEQRIAFIEAKARACTRARWAETLVPVLKVDRLRSLAAQHGSMGLVVICWADPCIGFRSFRGMEACERTEEKGWSEYRRGVRQKQPCYLVPTKTFKMLKLTREDYAALKGLPSQSH